jgi:hypothetical protein
MINQAVFKALYVTDDEITGDELAEPFAQLRTLQEAMHGVVDATTAEKPPTSCAQRTAKGPSPDWGQEPLAIGANCDVMVELGGLEPPTSWVRWCGRRRQASRSVTRSTSYRAIAAGNDT